MAARSAAVLALLLASLFTVPTLAHPIMVEIPEVRFQTQEDYVLVSFSSEDRVLVAYSEVEGARVSIYESANYGWIKVELINDTAVEQVLALSSQSPIYLNVSFVSSKRSVLLARYVVPANATLQLAMKIVPPAAPEKFEFDLLAMLTPRLPAWEYAVYLLLFPMFLATAYLDSRDYRKRHARWGKLDTFSLFIRYGFYASLISFLLILIGTIATSILDRFLYLGVQASIMDVVMALSGLVVLAAIYGFAKWRGWYDLIDE